MPRPSPVRPGNEKNRPNPGEPSDQGVPIREPDRDAENRYEPKVQADVEQRSQTGRQAEKTHSTRRHMAVLRDRQGSADRCV
jgi:hypothetical protein